MALNRGRSGDDRGSSGKRGFASMDEDKQREIASKGGKAAHEKGTAHEFTSEEAREAGKVAHEKGTAHEFSSEEARQAGRKGGKSRGKGALGGPGGPGGPGQDHDGDDDEDEDEDEDDEDNGSSSSTLGGKSRTHSPPGRHNHKNK